MKKETRLPANFRLSRPAIDALEAEAERTGKNKTRVVEDLLLWMRVFTDDAESALHILQRQTKLEARKVIEAALLKLAGIGETKLPLNNPWPPLKPMPACVLRD